MLNPSRPRVLIPLLIALLFSAAPPAPSAASTSWLDPYRDPAARLVGEALSSSFAWDRLALIGDTFGHRLSGSQALEDAIQWAVAEMKKDGLDNVHTEPVTVQHWVRGRESVEITSPLPR
jgi:carboxypeptidase Q